MPDQPVLLVDEVLAACQGGAAEAADALGRVLDGPTKLTAGEASTLAALAGSPLKSPGLAVVLSAGEWGVVVALPTTGGLVPDWCRDPDATGRSRLATLAQELGMLLVPERLNAEGLATAWVADLSAALQRGGAAKDAMALSLSLSVGEKQGAAWLIWPVAQPGLVAAEPTEPVVPPVAAESKKANVAVDPKLTQSKPSAPRSGEASLPPYTRSLLRISVPVVVTLAEKRQSLDRIIELSPGSIIQFDKSCEEMLELSVGNRRIACGEAVKVGDKFGLRIMAMTPPDERFFPVHPGSTASR